MHQLATAEATPRPSREANAHDAFFSTFDEEVGKGEEKCEERAWLNRLGVEIKSVLR
jgi:hypothetical protein